MSALHNMPIKRKVMLIILLSSMATLLLASAAIFIFQVIHIRQTITRDLATQGRIIAANSTAALAFNDSKAATEILASLKANPHILCSCLYLPNRELFAHDGLEAGMDKLPPGPLSEGCFFEGPNLSLYQPVWLNEKLIGMLYLRFDFKALQMEILRPYAFILGSILLSSSLLALLLSSRLQQIISVPILQLADTARAVAEQKDYSVRAQSGGHDEIGLLTHAFNRMLDHIEENDRNMRTVNQNLEAEVAERQRTENELRESRQRFEVAVLGSSDGIWDWNLTTKELYLSPRWKSMIGYADSELPNSSTQWESLMHPEDCPHFLEVVHADDAGDEGDDRAEAEDPGGGGAEDRALAHELSQMGTHGALFNPQLARDLAIGMRQQNKLEHLALAGRQFGNCGGKSSGSGIEQMVDQF